jgi:hypothetical protein
MSGSLRDVGGGGELNLLQPWFGRQLRNATDRYVMSVRPLGTAQSSPQWADLRVVLYVEVLFYQKSLLQIQVC